LEKLSGTPLKRVATNVNSGKRKTICLEGGEDVLVVARAYGGDNQGVVLTVTVELPEYKRRQNLINRRL